MKIKLKKTLKNMYGNKIDLNAIFIKKLSTKPGRIQIIGDGKKYRDKVIINFWKQETLNIYYHDNASFYSELNGYIVPNTSEFHYSNCFNLTTKFGYTDWNKFKQDYKYFRTYDSKIIFYRDDKQKGKIKKTNILEQYSLNKTLEYDSNIEEHNKGGTVAIATGPNSTSAYSTSGSLEWPFGPYTKSYHKIKIFDESITYRATAARAIVYVALQKYKKDGNLMLRVVYQVELSCIGTTRKIMTELFTGNYGQFY